MTGIRDFLATINKRPSCMARVNWAEETSRFSYRRIRAIIVGLEDDAICMKASNYIAKAWCKQTGRNQEEIEARLKSCLDERQEILQMKRYERKTKGIPVLDEDEYERLKKENECLKMKLEKYESDSQNPLYQARMEGIRTLVEQLIVYAEGEDKKVAREIKIALNIKLANGYIASNVLTDEWKQRLEDLGRDRPRRNDTMTFNNQVGTVVAHADQITLQYKENE